MTENGRCEVEIKGRVAMATESFNKRREPLTQTMDRILKKEIVKSVV